MDKIADKGSRQILIYLYFIYHFNPGSRYHYLKKADSVKKFNEDVSRYDGILSIPCFGEALSTAMKALTVFKGEKPKMVCMNTKHYRSVIDFWRKTGAIKKATPTAQTHVITEEKKILHWYRTQV